MGLDLRKVAYQVIQAAPPIGKRKGSAAPGSMSAFERLALLKLADVARDNTRLAWPSLPTLAAFAGCSKNAIGPAVKALEAAGHITAMPARPGRFAVYLVHPGGFAHFAPITQNAARAHLELGRFDLQAREAILSWLARLGVAPPEDTPPTAGGVWSAAANETDSNSPNGWTTPPQRLGHTPPCAGPEPGREPQLKQGEARERAPTGPDGEDGKGGADDPAAPAPTPTKATRLPADWTPPLIDTLPPQARALVGQWPQGAYQAVCETFRLHWTAESGARAAKRDWGAALGKWLVNDHGKVMRDARAGVNFAQLAPASGGGAARVVHQLVEAKAGECLSAQQVHRRLAAQLGQAMWAQWINPCAIILASDGATVICPSAFVRDWVQERFGGKIRQAIDEVALRTGSALRFEVDTGQAYGPAYVCPTVANVAA